MSEPKRMPGPRGMRGPRQEVPKGTFGRIVKALFKAYPGYATLTVICTLLSAFVTAIPATFQQRVLDALVIDTSGDHNTHDTARRMARMYLREVFAGRYQKAPAITEFPNASRLNELMIVGPITVRSACSHHFVPIMGRLWIGVLPNENTNVIGLSKYARLAEWVMGRPQIQEEAVVQLADLIQQKTNPDGLAIVMQATHFCMAWRGVKDAESRMLNSVMRGAFLTNPTLRREFLALIPRHQQSS